MAGNRIAIVVIDMQKDFLDPGAPIEAAGGLEIIPHIQKLLEAGRRRKLPVIFTQEVHRAGNVDGGINPLFEPDHCLEGTPGVEIVAELPRLPGEYLVQKRRFSAFFHSDLDLLLRGLGVDTVILVGVTTDICVRATALDARQYGYRVLVPPECVAGTTPARHQAALENIDSVFGKVRPLMEVLELIEGVDG